MKIKSVINLLGATESGVSKATGNPWKSKEVVIEFKNDGDAVASTMALKTFNTNCIETLEQCVEGDSIIANVTTRANYREFTRADGTSGGIRSTDCFLDGVEVTEQKGF